MDILCDFLLWNWPDRKYTVQLPDIPVPNAAIWLRRTWEPHNWLRRTSGPHNWLRRTSGPHNWLRRTSGPHNWLRRTWEPHHWLTAPHSRTGYRLFYSALLYFSSSNSSTGILNSLQLYILPGVQREKGWNVFIFNMNKLSPGASIWQIDGGETNRQIYGLSDFWRHRKVDRQNYRSKVWNLNYIIIHF